ncbi:hypothetical protein ACQUZK_08655 [Streptococcus pyogenes]|uniref:hypothetical protein n=1 Tax=Streptococcus pyogenes TaxID=1314 RepID=UPI003DA148E7
MIAVFITFTPYLDTVRHASTTKALARWYDERAAVLRLWAILPEAAADGTTVRPLRVLLLLQPSPDGNDTAPAWVAHGPAWSRELEQRLARAVQLECIDAGVADSFEIDGDGALLASLCWRDPTVLGA